MAACRTSFSFYSAHHSANHDLKRVVYELKMQLQFVYEKKKKQA